jgi:hypothetical protein
MRCRNSHNPGPQRIVSLNVASRRLGVSRGALEKYLRRGMITADFTSDRGTYFLPSSLKEIRSVIRNNRALKRKHCGAVNSI